ncbi:hypothetical protein ABZ249_01835 [Nocardiopsis sp. NPDC006139]|uniref:hypothetical protein n=1 Tax=Nocardiopsis sp. NPDC006139 TaxID=3154578 RepID=UPI0033B723AF
MSDILDGKRTLVTGGGRGIAPGRSGAPEEIAEAAARPVSPSAGYATGARPGVDGGSDT